MKAPAFAYVKPSALGEVFDLLERHEDGAKLLAGGQSLIPTLNLRLSSPDLLVDITGLPGLSNIATRNGTIRIGALVTHAQIENSFEIKKHLPLLAQAVLHIAHPAIRNRGTLGGSLALADPAAEYPACALALDATLVIASKKAERRVKAADFFKGLFETDLKPGEVLVAAEFPVAEDGERCVFLELARRQGDYAIVGIALRKTKSDLKIAFLGAGATPVLAKHAAVAAKNSIDAAKEALAKDLRPPADLYHSPAAKLHLARVLLGRALG